MQYQYKFLQLALQMLGVIQTTHALSSRSPDGGPGIFARDDDPLLRPIPDRYTPHGQPVKWLGLGDSFTSAPGCGRDYDDDKHCWRNEGSYVIKLRNNFPFTETNGKDFWACNGFTANDVLTRTVPAIQKYRYKYDFMVMTLGGNDLEFGKLAINCFINPDRHEPYENCNAIVNQAQATLNSGKFATRMFNVYDALFNLMRDDYHYQIYHVLYPRFFNDQSNWCNDEKMVFWGPKLTRNLRIKLNRLTNNLNSRLEGIARSYNDYKRRQGRSSFAKAPRVITINPDAYNNLFHGHRFCDWKDLRSDNVYFFAPFAHDFPGLTANSTSSENEARLLEAATSNGTNGTDVFKPEWLAKSFHPKTIGQTQLWRILYQTLQQRRPAERAANGTDGMWTNSTSNATFPDNEGPIADSKF